VVNINNAEKALCRSVYYDNMTLYFEYRINKNALLRTVFLGDFAHWDSKKIIIYG